MNEEIDLATWEQKANALLDSHSFQETMAFLIAVLQQLPRDPKVYFHMARTHELLGKYHDAVAAFDRAFELGLAGHEVRDAYVCLGRIFRAVGEYRHAKDILTEARQRFPGFRPLTVYYAIVLFNLGENVEAFGLLLRQLAETTAHPDLLPHRESLLFLSDKLSATFED